MAKVKKARKARSNITDGVVTIFATFNNTIITVTDNKEVLVQSSAGAVGYKGARKSSPYAAQEVANDILKKLADNNITLASVLIRVKGPGPGRDGAARVLLGANFKVRAIQDVTPDPHNGPRRRKKRRV